MATTLAVATASAQPRSLKVEGTAGFLSEWELSGAVSGAADDLSGNVTWKHVGLCSVNGPEEKRGDIRVRISGAGRSAKVNATLSFDRARCVYSGPLAESMTGIMTCSDTGAVPISLSIR